MAKRRSKPPAPPAPDVGPPPEAAPPPPVAVMSPYDLAGSSDRGAAAMRDLAERQGRAYGRNTMLPLSEAPIARIRRLPFGIFWLDLRTRGGIVVQRINRIWGPPSTLKSTLCLRIIRSAQRHCRHCKYPLVMDPDRARIDCRCPPTRWWLLNEEDYGWLPMGVGLVLARGELPPGADPPKSVDGRMVSSIRCAVPPSVTREKAKPRDILLAETHRCEPWRTMFVDSERTTDILWAIANGVVPEIVQTIGARWGEQSLDTTLAALNDYTAVADTLGTKSREVDLMVVDSTSMLETAVNLAKRLEDAPKVASRAMLLGRWIRAFLSASADEGLIARYTPTVLTTSQIATHGLGGKQHAYLAPTDGWTFQHGIALDIKMAESGYTFNEAKTRARWGEFEFFIKKNKAGGSPGVAGTIKFWVNPEPGHAVGDSDDVSIVMDAARKLGAADPTDWIAPGKGRSAFVLHTRYVKDGRASFARVGDVENFLDSNPTIYDDLRARVMDYLLEHGEGILNKPERGASPDAEMGDV